MSGPLSGKSKSGSSRQWTIGASPQCDVWTDVPSVSGTHCRFVLVRQAGTIESSRFTVEDLGSTNGTFVQGHRIDSPTLIGPESVVTLGTIQPIPWPTEAGAIRVITFGANAANQLVLSEAGVSSFHGRLIVGPHNTLVVEDLNSTNGVCVAKTAGGELQPSHRIKNAALVQSTDCLMLGSTPLRVSSLLSAPVPQLTNKTQSSGSVVATNLPSTKQSQPAVVVPSLPATSSVSVASPSGSTSKNNQAADRRYWIGGGIALLALLLVWTIGALSPSDDSVEVSSAVGASAVGDSSERVANGADRNGGDDAPGIVSSVDSQVTVSESRVTRDAPESPSVVTSEAGISTQNRVIDPVSRLADPNQAALFHVMVQSSDALASFRVGTAWAYDERTLLTSALVVKAMESQQKNGFPAAVAVHAATGDLYALSQPRKHQALEDQLAKSVKAINDFESARNQKTTPRPNAKDAESAVAQRRERLNQLGEEMLKMRTAFVAYDVGRLRVTPPLSAEVRKLKLATNSMLRPKQKLTLLSSPFDTEDPYYDPDLPADFENSTWRVEAIPRVKSLEDGNDLPRLILSGPSSPSQSESSINSGSGIQWNRFGSPLVDSAGRVVSVFSTPAIENQGETMQVEGPAAISYLSILK